MTAAPRLEPSTSNCTLATPTLSDAVAVTVIVPETVAPELGELIDTVGGVVPAGWVLELELTNPLHPECIRAKNTTSKHPSRVITWVDPAGHLRIFILAILDLAVLKSAERSAKHTCHRFFSDPALEKLQTNQPIRN